MGESTSDFDAAGPLTSSTDARGQTLWHTYDELNRVVELRDTNATGLRSAAWEFDTVRPGLLSFSTAFPDGGGTTVTVGYGYDDRGRTTAKTWQALLVPDGATSMGWTYRRDDSTATTAYPTGETVTHGHDRNGQATSMAGWASYVSDAGYELDGQLASRRTSVDGQGGFKELFFYDTVHRGREGTQAFADSGLTVPVVDDRYQRDSVGNIVRRDDHLAGQQECFGHDDLDRLTAAFTTALGADCDSGPQPGVGPDPYSASWGYDPVGNMTQALGDGTVNGGYTYADPAHRHAVTQAGPVALTYNPFGAVATRTVTGEPTQTFAYDQTQRLVSVTNGSVTTELVYDADGHRLARTTTGPPPSPTTTGSKTDSPAVCTPAERSTTRRTAT